MIEQELIFLGLLKESPRHGYEIKKKIKEILSLFAGVNLKSIYYPLRVLERQGFVVKKAAKSGRRPVRFVYELTPKGEKRFDELLSRSLLNFKRPQFSLDLSLYFLHYIDPKSARRRLRGRIFILKKITDSIERMLKGNRHKKKLASSLARICEHNIKMLEAEAEFLVKLIKTL